MLFGKVEQPRFPATGIIAMVDLYTCLTCIEYVIKLPFLDYPALKLGLRVSKHLHSPSSADQFDTEHWIRGIVRHIVLRTATQNGIKGRRTIRYRSDLNQRIRQMWSTDGRFHCGLLFHQVPRDGKVFRQ